MLLLIANTGVKEISLRCVYIAMSLMHTPQLDDEEIIPLVLKDSAYFSILIDRYEQKIRRYICRISKLSPEDAEDMLQEIFLKCYQHLNRFDTTLSFSSWIYRIAHNHIRSQHRKKMARPQSVILDPAVYEQFRSDEDIGSLVDQQLANTALTAALDQLKEPYRSVLILKFLEEKSYTEISDILQKPSGTVGTLINRAKKKLKIIIETQGRL